MNRLELDPGDYAILSLRDEDELEAHWAMAEYLSAIGEERSD